MKKNMTDNLMYFILGLILGVVLASAFVGYFYYDQITASYNYSHKDWTCHMQIDYNKQVSTGDFNFVLKTFDLTLPCGEFEVKNLFQN